MKYINAKRCSKSKTIMKLDAKINSVKELNGTSMNNMNLSFKEVASKVIAKYRETSISNINKLSELSFQANK